MRECYERTQIPLLRLWLATTRSGLFVEFRQVTYRIVVAKAALGPLRPIRIYRRRTFLCDAPLALRATAAATTRLWSGLVVDHLAGLNVVIHVRIRHRLGGNRRGDFLNLVVGRVDSSTKELYMTMRTQWCNAHSLVTAAFLRRTGVGLDAAFALQNQAISGRTSEVRNRNARRRFAPFSVCVPTTGL